MQKHTIKFLLISSGFQVAEALGDGNADEVVINYFGIPMKRSDIQTLKDGAWLNDEVRIRLDQKKVGLV